MAGKGTKFPLYHDAQQIKFAYKANGCPLSNRGQPFGFVVEQSFSNKKGQTKSSALFNGKFSSTFFKRLGFGTPFLKRCISVFITDLPAERNGCRLRWKCSLRKRPLPKYETIFSYSCLLHLSQFPIRPCRIFAASHLGCAVLSLHNAFLSHCAVPLGTSSLYTIILHKSISNPLCN